MCSTRSGTRSLNPERILALSVVQDPEEERLLHEQWHEYDIPIELHTVSSPYRELTRPVLSFLDEIDQESDDDIITVVIPESVTKVTAQVAAQPVCTRAESSPAVPPGHCRGQRAGPHRLSRTSLSPSPRGER